MANINVETTWTFIKALIGVGTKLHYIENSKEYRIFTFNGQILYETYLFKDSGSVILEDATQNDTDLSDFEDNYKSSANSLEYVKVSAELESNQEINATIQNQDITNNFRVVALTSNQSLSDGSYTTIYSYSGSGSVYGSFMKVTDDNTELKVLVDSVAIINGITVSDIPVAGPGASGNGPELSAGLWRSSTTEINFKPPKGIIYSSSIQIQLQAHGTNKKLVSGLISLTKVT